MALVYLITIEDIKKESIIPSNTTNKVLYIALREVTDLELEPLIGTEYLNKLNQGVENDTLSVKDEDVIDDVIKPFLIYGTLSYSIKYLHHKLNNKGVNVSTDATLSASTPKFVDSFQVEINQKWDSYKRRLINYFKNDNDEETETIGSADTTGNTLGFYLPDKSDYGVQFYKESASKVNYRRY